MYSLKNVLTQTPEKVKNTILAIGAAVAGVMAQAGYNVDIATVGLIGLAGERVLDLFYVAPTRAAQNEKQALVAFENVKLNATRRPLHAD